MLLGRVGFVLVQFIIIVDWKFWLTFIIIFSFLYSDDVERSHILSSGSLKGGSELVSEK